MERKRHEFDDYSYQVRPCRYCGEDLVWDGHEGRFICLNGPEPEEEADEEDD
jgi:hypothetical protein